MWLNDDNFKTKLPYLKCFIMFVNKEKFIKKCDFLRGLLIFKILFSILVGFLMGISGLSGIITSFLYFLSISIFIFTYINTLPNGIKSVEQFCDNIFTPLKYFVIQSYLIFLLAWYLSLKIYNFF